MCCPRSFLDGLSHQSSHARVLLPLSETLVTRRCAQCELPRDGRCVTAADNSSGVGAPWSSQSNPKTSSCFLLNSLAEAALNPEPGVPVPSCTTRIVRVGRSFTRQYDWIG